MADIAGTYPFPACGPARMAILWWQIHPRGSDMLNQNAMTLLAVLVGRDEHTHAKIVERFEKCARDNDEDATLSVRTLRRWMTGQVMTEPRPSQRRVARLFWGYPMSELLAPAPPGFVVEAARADRADHSALTSNGMTTPVPLGPSSAPIPPVGEAAGTLESLERQVTMATRRAARF